MTYTDLSFPLKNIRASKLSQQILLACHSPWLLSTSEAAGTTSSKDGSIVTSLPLLKTLLLKCTSGPLAHCVCRGPCNKPSNYKDSSFLCSIIVPRGISPPHSPGFPSLFYGCGFMFGLIREPVFTLVHLVNQIGLCHWTVCFLFPQLHLLRTWSTREVCTHLGHW